MLSNIKIRSITGAGIKIYIPSIAQLRIEVLKAYPFLYDGNLDEETQSLKKLAHCNESIAVLVFDGAKLVGASTGLPLEEDSPEIQYPVSSHGLNPTDYFHFEDSVLLPSYRGRGIGHHFFDLREAHAKHLKRFHHVSFCTILAPEEDPERPKDYISLENFWKKRGYVIHPEMQCQILKKEIDKEEPVLKTLTFWLKELQLAQ